MRIFGMHLCGRRNKVAILEERIAVLERTLIETTPNGPCIHIQEDDGTIGVYQRITTLPPPHWTDAFRSN